MYESKNPPKCCAKDMDENEENIPNADPKDSNDTNETEQSSSEIDENAFQATA